MVNGNNYKVILSAFERTYRRNICGMVCYACKFVSIDAANDIVQSVFLKLWEQDSSFFLINDYASQQLYLYKCVKNACQDYLKHIKVTENHSKAIVNSIRLDEVNWYDRYMDREEHHVKMQTLKEHIALLPPKCKEIFGLHYMQQKSCAEIATMMGLSVRTVESHIYRALQLIRKNTKK